MSLTLTFPDLATAQQIYRVQLARERLFVPTATPPPPGTPTNLTLRILESGGALTLAVTVISHLDAKQAQQHQLGTTGGVVLHVPILDEIKEPLRALLTGATSQARTTPTAGKDKVKTPTESPEALEQRVKTYLEETRDGTFYDILRVQPGSSPETIRASYLTLMRLYHPDNYFGRIPEILLIDLEHAYQQITAAFETLVDPKKRDRYDIQIGHFGDSIGGSSAEVKMRRAELEEYKAKNAPKIRKAKELFDAAVEDEAAGRKADAVAKIRLAISFDPRNPIFPNKLRALEKS